MINIDDIIIPKRIRSLNGERVEELAKSIAEVRLIHPPVINNGKLVAGYHRIAAYQKLGYTQIKCSEMGDVNNLSSLALLEIDENLSRYELSAAEKAEHLALRVKHSTAGAPNKTAERRATIAAVEELSNQLGSSPSSVRDSIRKHIAIEAVELPEEQKQALSKLSTAQYNRVAHIAKKNIHLPSVQDTVQQELKKQLSMPVGSDLAAHDAEAKLKRTRRRLQDARSIARTNKGDDESENKFLQDVIDAVTAWVEYHDNK
ncbi:MAG: ParB-like chromosome segregation protein Spo0J [Oleiphilaceae bacterium]|jgi:ParB-like chromosome segregation protein Spo0J